MDSDQELVLEPATLPPADTINSGDLSLATSLIRINSNGTDEKKTETAANEISINAISAAEPTSLEASGPSNIVDMDLEFAKELDRTMNGRGEAQMIEVKILIL